MTKNNCPFSRSNLAESCFLLKQREELDSTIPCAFDSVCWSAKKVIENDPNASITLIKKALTSNIPAMVLTASINQQRSMYDNGGEPMDSQINDLKNTTRAELEKHLIDSNHVTNNALSIISDLIHLNIATIQKSIEDSTEAIHQMLHANDHQSLVSSLTSQQATVKERAAEYTKNLSSIAQHVREHNAESINTNMTYLAEKMQHFIDQINSADPTWLNYREHLKTNLASAQSAFVDLTKKTHDFQANDRKSWPSANESSEKSSSKKSKKS